MRNSIPVREIRIPSRRRALLHAIGKIAAGRGVPAYAVGGCVRDWLLRVRGTPDLDIAVEGSGVEVAREVARAFQGAVDIHPPFGTATVRIPRRGRRAEIRIDVATCRKETYAKAAAYPRVFPGTLEEDLFRRDFTINAMAMAIGPGRFGWLIDPFSGAKDLRARALRILHGRSFVDDPSRVLRGVRFAQRFGLRWAPATEQAARAAVEDGALGWLNPGRLRRELERMTHEPDPLGCFQQLARLLDHRR